MELTSLRFATAIVRSASLVTYLADLQLGGSPALLPGVAIAHHITAIAADDVVLVALPPADMPAPAPLILAVYKGSASVAPSHDILTTHTYTGGAALDVFGLSAASTLAKLTPSSNPGAAAAILCSAAAGNLTLTGLMLHQAGNANLEIGRVDGSASTPYIDFHSGATALDYDARIIASGGTGSVGGGTLTIVAADFVGSLIRASVFGRWVGTTFVAKSSSATIVATLPAGFYLVHAVGDDANWHSVAWVQSRNTVVSILYEPIPAQMHIMASGNDLQVSNNNPTYDMTIHWGVINLTTQL